MPEKSKAQLIVVMHADELAMRLLETFMKRKRPEGLTARECLEDVNNHDPELHECFTQAALTAMEYFRERSEAAHRTH